MADAGSSSSCVPRSIDLPFTGICPPSELTCPPCPDTAPYKCPSGGCQANVRDCKPNVVLHGPCNSTTCIESHWCHILPGFTYACWEISPSDHNATLTFSALDEGRCSTCNPLISRYVCSSCCGTRGVAAWTGSYETNAPDRLGGGVFMHGSRWVCLLRDVAAGMTLANTAANLVLPPPPPPPPAAAPSPPPPPPPEFDAFTFPMPGEYSLESMPVPGR